MMQIYSQSQSNSNANSNSNENTFESSFWGYLSTIGCSKLISRNIIDRYNSQIIAYHEMQSKVMTKMKQIYNKIINVDFRRNSQQLHKEQIQLYNQIYDNLLLFEECDELNIELNSKNTSRALFYDPCIVNISHKIDRICKCSQDTLDNDKLDMDVNMLEQINISFNILRAISESKLVELLDNDKKGGIESIILKIKSKIDTRLQKLNQLGLDSTNNPEVFVRVLVTLSMANQTLQTHKKIAQKGIDECLRKYYKENPAGIAQLADLLDKNETGIWGAILTTEHKMFSGERVSKFNKATNEQKIDKVLQLIECNDKSINTKVLEKEYDKFESEYRELVDKYLKEELNLDPLISNISIKAANARELIQNLRNKQKNAWNNEIKDILVELIANVFAVWTLDNSKYYFDTKSQKSVDDPKSYLKQPKAAQKVSVLRLLSVDNKKSKLARHLVQIGTGEGKSLTLAVTSCILALVGYQVSCACYSEYLSSRDYVDFESLFTKLGIGDHINYGTFNQLCERIINENGNVRQMVESLVKTRANTKDDLFDDQKVNVDDFSIYGVNSYNRVQLRYSNSRPKILLIDEVDVFFDKNFYGNTYTPCAMIRDIDKTNNYNPNPLKEIKQLTDYIWEHYTQYKAGVRSDMIGFTTIKNSTEYANCQLKFGKYWISLIDEAIKDMLACVMQVESEQYQVTKSGKIGYKENDQINTKANKGYRTMFSYYLEKDSGNCNVNNSDWLNSIAIYLRCGSFSYAEIPSQFDVILGVSGTLKTLSKTEQRVIFDKYNISRHTYIPSLYGPRKEKFVFKHGLDIRLMENSTFFENLKEEICDRMNTHGKPRCVFVCFENKRKLNEFYQCKEFLLFQANTLKLSEDADKDEKSSIIKRATLSGNILLLTKEFGRGTDFQVNDKIVKSNGGPHVIQTFLSLQKSEEIQIQGRTARQGGRGSYSMILNQDELMDKFAITHDEIKESENNNTLYHLLDSKRTQKFETSYQENETFVEDAHEAHQRSIKFVKCLTKRDVEHVKNELIEFNHGPPLMGSSKIIVAMDATGSMSQLLQQAKKTVHTTFERVSQILLDFGYDRKCFEIQFMAYRNYNAPTSDLLLQRSNWSSDSVELQNFLHNVAACYGWGEEAIEVVLQYININCSDCNQVIIIGDAAPTCTMEKVNTRRKQYEQHDWAKDDLFKSATFYETEIEKFRLNGIIANCYYLDEGARKAFEWMAKQTGGECDYLNVDDISSTEKLTSIVSKIVLSACDKGTGGDLVNEYKKRFDKLMHSA